MANPAYAPLDDALTALRGYGSVLVNGNFNHAPMVAEALCAMGRPEAVPAWLERYRPRLVPRGAAGPPVDAARWREALGERGRFAAWSALFAAALREAPWRDVVDLWAGRLAPGISAAATHGAIRVGHAVRGLGDSETPPRLAELADALASWAASYAELRAAAGAGQELAPRAAIGRVAVVPPAERPGNIAAALARLNEFPEFAPAIGLARLDGGIEGRLAELTELFARIYLANVRDVPSAIVFIHGVTSLAALGHIAPAVGEGTARAVLRYGWQAACGLYACFGGAGLAGEIAAVEADEEALVEQAIANGDEHVIKFTEACLSRHRLAPSPAYPAAVAQVLATFGRR